MNRKLMLHSLLCCVFWSRAIGEIVLQVTDQEQELTSPGYPGNYPSDSTETWLLTTSGQDSSRGTWVVNINVEYFQMEDHSSCAYDYLDVIDANSSSLVDRLCGDLSAPDISFSSTGPDLKLYFNSDYSVTYKGFVIKYWASYSSFAVVTQAPKSDRKETNNNVIGWVLGALGVMIIIGLVVYIVCRRKYQKKSTAKRITKKVFITKPDGSLGPAFKTSIKIRPSTDLRGKAASMNLQFPSASSISGAEPKPGVSRKRPPIDSASVGGDNTPAAFRYVEPTYPPGYGSTPY
ncbi:adhesion G-protein coupled receptor G6-like [Haliotis cracherodii]|uniref:adhesion G-protein coupled receptor G6-like n=1 Tax=Haliotis cracherodii TaxID=6455 RepID=UPI0039ED85E4